MLDVEKDLVVLKGGSSKEESLKKASLSGTMIARASYNEKIQFCCFYAAKTFF